MPYPKNKYRKGYTIFGVGHLSVILTNGSWVYLDDKAYHPGFILSMQYRAVLLAEANHRFCEVIDCRKEWNSNRYEKPFPEGVTESRMR